MYVTRHLCLSEQAHNAEASGSLINMYNAEQSQSTVTLSRSDTLALNWNDCWSLTKVSKI